MHEISQFCFLLFLLNFFIKAMSGAVRQHSKVNWQYKTVLLSDYTSLCLQ